MTKSKLFFLRLSGVDMADIRCEASRDNSWSGHPCKYRINTQGKYQDDFEFVVSKGFSFFNLSQNDSYL